MNREVLPVLKELEEYKLSDIFGNSEKVINNIENEIEKKNYILKTRLGLSYNPIYLYRNSTNHRCFKLLNISGMIRIGNFDIEIAPKFIIDKDKEWRRSLFNVINLSNNKWLLADKVFNLSYETLNFYDHLSLALIESLQNAIKYEDIHTYNSNIEESNFLKGRLLISEQLKRLVTKPGVLVSECDYFDTNNEYYYLLNWGLKRLIYITKSERIKALLREVKTKLPKVSKIYKIPILTKTPPQYSHYDEAITICNLLAQGLSITHNHTNKTGYGYVVNMEKTFEKFIENLLKIIVKEETHWSFEAQSYSCFAKPLDKAHTTFYTVPDNKLSINGESAMLIDAKYKSSLSIGINKRPVNSDMYQLFCSLISHNCSRGLLINPCERNTYQPNAASVWEIKHNNEKFLIASLSIDITNLINVANLKSLMKIIKDTILYLRSI